MMKIRDLKKKRDKKKIKVLWYSNSIKLPTGFAKVTREVCKRLAKDSLFEVHIAGENETGPPYQWEGCLYHPAGTGNKNVPPVDGLNRVIKEINPDLLIILEDSFTMDRHQIFNIPPDLPFLFYVPHDGMNSPGPDGILIQRRANQIIPMAHFTKEVCEMERFPSIGPVIWHGVDLEQLNTVSDDEKKELKKKYGFKEDDFLVFWLYRNSARKQPQTQVELAWDFLDKTPDNVKCFFHVMNWKNRENNLEDFARRVLPNHTDTNHWQKRLLFTSTSIDPQKSASDEEVANYYKMADVVAHASTGEGTGLIMLEAMACGIPIVAVNHTTSPEFLADTFDDNGIGARGLLTPTNTRISSSFNVEHYHLSNEDRKDFVDALIRLYEDPELTKRLGKNGRIFAEQYLDWNDLVFNQWVPLIKDMVG